MRDNFYSVTDTGMLYCQVNSRDKRSKSCRFSTSAEIFNILLRKVIPVVECYNSTDLSNLMQPIVNLPLQRYGLGIYHFHRKIWAAVISNTLH